MESVKPEKSSKGGRCFCKRGKDTLL